MGTIDQKPISIQIGTAIKAVFFLLSVAVAGASIYFPVASRITGLEERVSKQESMDLSVRLTRLEIDIQYIKQGIAELKEK
jgi:hypothetical protein